MRLERFSEKFDQLVDIPDAVAQVRELVLELALQGGLVETDVSDESVEKLLCAIQDEKKELVNEGMLKRFERLEPFPDKSLKRSIPSHWKVAPLASLCVSVTDGDHLPPPKAETGVPFLVIGNVRWGGVDFSNCRFVAEEYYQNLDWIRKPRKGDILYTLVGSLGIPVVVNNSKQFCVQRHIGILRPSKYIDLHYLAYALASKSVFQQATIIATGIAQKTVPLAGLRRIAIPLPPFAEQKRIVAKVDELMALCDRLEAQFQERDTRRTALARAALVRFAKAPTPENLELLFHDFFAIDPPDLRKTILTLAVQGKLVHQDPNDDPAGLWLQTISSLRQSRKTKLALIADGKKNDEIPFMLPKGWIRLRVDQAFEVAGGIQKTPHRTPRNNAFPYLGVANVYRGHLDLSNVKEFELEEGELERRKLEPGDLLIIEGNGSFNEIGRCAKWNGEIPNCVHQNHVIRCRPFDTRIGSFVLLFLNSPAGMEIMQRLAITSSGLYSLSVGKIRQIEFPLPPLAEQKRIVAKVDQLMALVDQLEAQLIAKRETANRLLAALVAELTTTH